MASRPPGGLEKVPRPGSPRRVCAAVGGVRLAGDRKFAVRSSSSKNGLAGVCTDGDTESSAEPEGWARTARGGVLGSTLFHEPAESGVSGVTDAAASTGMTVPIGAASARDESSSAP
eukprot:1383565-Lingulodinium_polyedra.AAC.1